MDLSTSYQIETVEIPLIEAADDSLLKPLIVDTQMISEPPPLVPIIISNQLISEPIKFQADPSNHDDTLIVDSCSCQAKTFKPKKGVRKNFPVRKYVYEDYVDKFKDLRELKPINEDFGGVTIGFTKKQVAILEHQMRVYTQLSTQHFLQTFSHPKFWVKANQFKTDLQDLEENVRKSTLNVCNLKNAVQFLEKWTEDLSEVNEENKKHIEFIEAEMFRGRQAGPRLIMRFPPKVMQAILTEEVFLYPEFVPRVAFRTDVPSDTFQEFSPSELT